jgi:hypothetical protein
MPLKLNNVLMYWRKKYFNGLLSLLTNRMQYDSKVRSILFAASADWKFSNKAKEWVEKKFVNANILYIIRDDYPDGYEKEAKIVSTSIISLSSKLKTVLELRKRRFDIVVVVWSGERSYGALKLLALVVAAKSILVFNENVDCFWLMRQNYHVFLNHIINRFRQKVGSASQLPIQFYFFRRILSFIFLLPLGMLYVITRVLYYSIKRICLSSRNYR